MSRTDLFSEVETFLRSHHETKMEMDFDAAVECRCGIHRAVKHSDERGVGCERWAPGSMRSIAALYEPGYVRYCHAEPGQRVLDVKMARLSVSGAPLAAYLGDGMKPVMKYVKGGPVSVKYLGAGFCYGLPFLAGARVRVGRVLGPKGFGLDILRLVRVVGSPEMPSFSFEEVRPGLWHLEEVEGPRVPTALFVEQLLDALKENPKLYVGVSAEVQECLDKLAKLGFSPEQLLSHVAMGSFSQWKYEGSVVKPGLLPAGGFPLLYGPVSEKEDVALWVWLKQRGFELSSEALGYLQLLKLSPSDQATLVDRGRERLKMLAVVGDTVLDMSAVSMVLGIDGQGADFDRFRKKCQNSDLAIAFDRLDLVQVIADGSTRNKADSFEALVGVVAIFEGFEVALKMCRQFVFEVDW